MQSASIRFLALALASVVAPSTCTNTTRQCKSYPGTDAWPSSRTWSQLNQTLNGHLLVARPPGGICHPDRPEFDETGCAELKKEWTTYDWHSQNPVSVMWDNWSNWTCLPDAELPCSPDGYPAYVVNASTAEHVKAGVDFARENNVRLVVKSSGHDFLGRSVAPGALSIWVHHLNSISYHTGEFGLSGSNTVISGDAVTAGGGTPMYDVYKATDAHKATVAGGGAKSVTLGGYITGGGHSALSQAFGLAADNVLEMEVVTPKGDILTVNEDQHPDLFWALRGGGGSTFGVITSVTMASHPTPKIQHVLYTASINSNSTRFNDFMAFILGQIPTMMEAGLSGYSFFSPVNAVPAPIPGVPAEVPGLAGSLLLLDEDREKMASIFDRLNATMQDKFDGAATLTAYITSYDSWLDWYDVNFDNGTAGSSALVVSRLLDEEAITSDPQAFRDAAVAATEPGGYIQLLMVGGKGVNDAVPRGGSNSVNPGWRKALVHSLASSPIIPLNQTDEKRAINALDSAFEPLRKLTPGMGAYVNEALPYERNFQHTFWGENYERLLDIKRSIDPDDVLWCSPCVGNERWEQDESGRLCKINGDVLVRKSEL